MSHLPFCPGANNKQLYGAEQVQLQVMLTVTAGELSKLQTPLMLCPVTVRGNPCFTPFLNK